MKCIGNDLRFWFTPAELIAAGVDQVLPESLVSKDRWISNEAFVLTYPPMGDLLAEDEARLLFRG
jgi:hypothetical protein